MQVVDLIEEIINSIRDTFAITSIDDLGGGYYTINTTDTKDLADDDYVTISGNSYQVSELVADTSFKVSSTTEVIGTLWIADAPYYFHGTPIAIANTINHIFDGKLKYPVIILFERLRERVNDDITMEIGRIAPLRMFFGTLSKYADWTTDEHYTNVLIPIQTLVDGFVEALKKSAKIGELETHEEEPRANWGLFRDDSGSVKSIFNENLSGKEFSIDLPIVREQNITNC